jgi:hypothetical protein
MDDELISRKAAALRLHCSLSTLDRLRADGKLSWMERRGRVLFSEEQLRSYEETCVVQWGGGEV